MRRDQYVLRAALWIRLLVDQVNCCNSSFSCQLSPLHVHTTSTNKASGGEDEDAYEDEDGDGHENGGDDDGGDDDAGDDDAGDDDERVGPDPDEIADGVATPPGGSGAAGGDSAGHLVPHEGDGSAASSDGASAPVESSLPAEGVDDHEVGPTMSMAPAESSLPAEGVDDHEVGPTMRMAPAAESSLPAESSFVERPSSSIGPEAVIEILDDEIKMEPLQEEPSTAPDMACAAVGETDMEPAPSTPPRQTKLHLFDEPPAPSHPSSLALTMTFVRILAIACPPLPPQIIENHDQTQKLCFRLHAPSRRYPRAAPGTHEGQIGSVLALVRGLCVCVCVFNSHVAFGCLAVA